MAMITEKTMHLRRSICLGGERGRSPKATYSNALTSFASRKPSGFRELSSACKKLRFLPSSVRIPSPFYITIKYPAHLRDILLCGEAGTMLERI